MPLFIEGTKVEKQPDIHSFAKSYGHFQDEAEALLSQDPQEIGPKGLLYLCQREIAGSCPTDETVSFLGSQDATTCHIAVLRHTGSGATSMCHFDGTSTMQGLKTMISIVNDLTEDGQSGRLEMHLVGGFLDEKENSHEVSNLLLGAMFNIEEEIHLKTACITHFNTTYKEGSVPFPIIYGIACNVSTGEIFRAWFPDKGPDMALRSAGHFSGQENLVIYDNKSQCLAIGPFHYESPGNVDMLLAWPNHLIRKYLSTSPAQEPEGFEDQVKATLLHMKNFPNPLHSVFKDGKARRYKKDAETGLWNPLT